MTKISIATVRALINYLCNKQNKILDREELLISIEITQSQLNNVQGLIASRHYEQLFSLAEQKLANPCIGFDFGRANSPERWGVLGYIAFTCESLSDALTKQRKYQSLVGNLGTPLIENIDNTFFLKWLPANQCSYHVVEEIITGWAALSSRLCSDKISPSAVYFTHQFKGSETDLKRYQAFFGCQLHFNHDFNGIQIDSSALKIPLNTYDERINKTLCAQADSMLAELLEQSPVESVRQFIINQLPFGLPEIEEAAALLGLSIRTLQRKLRENHLTFSIMVDNIRQELACSYLKNTPTKIIYITQMLGFSEQSAFQRAFKRWTNQTPKQYRERAK